MGAAVISAPSRCPEVELLESGEVEVCHHPFARWTGAELDEHDKPIFVINRRVITAGGRVIARHEADTIVVTLTEGVEDARLHIDEKGKVLDDAGATVATIAPPPSGELEELVFAALVREAILLPALPPEKAARVSALKVQVLGAGDKGAKRPTSLCDCAAGAR